MTSFERVRVPTWHRQAGAAPTVAEIDQWLGSAPMQALVEAFGGGLRSTDPREVALTLDAFAAANWDFRRGRERDTARRAELDASLSDLIVSAATALGLATAAPPARSAYDAVLVLGGLVRACVVRPRYAAELIRGGTAVGEVVALGAFRSLSESERELAARLQVRVDDEFDAMTAGVRAAFGEWLTEPPSVRGEDTPGSASRSWRVVQWAADASAGLPRGVSIVAAPTLRPDADRANTAETYDFWAGDLRAPSVRSVLIITNPVYVPYQGCVAIQALGTKHDLDVETVGVSDEAADLGPDTQPFGPQEYLQEIRSTIGAMTRLRIELVG